jgi:arsenate reductase
MPIGCSARLGGGPSDTVIEVSEFRVFHNPRCSKSRAALEIVELHKSRGRKIEIVRYLDDPPDADTIRMLIATLDGSPGDLVRRDPALREMGVNSEQLSDPDVVVRVLIEAPELMQRPLISNGSRTVIGRPLEHISEMLDG